MIEIAAYLLIGSLAGFLGGLLGVGGGAIVVPCLVYIFSHSSSPHQNAMQLAIGTSLAAMIFTSGSSALAHYKKNGLTIHLVKFLAPGVIIGSMLGALIAGMIPSQDLKLIFGIIVSLLGIYFLIFSNLNDHGAEQRQVYFYQLTGIGLFIGALSSFLGLGGGIITVPILNYLNVPLKSAISTSAMTSFIIALFGAMSFLVIGLTKGIFTADSFGFLYWPAFVSIGIAATLAAPWGARLAYKAPNQILKKIFGSMLILVGSLMLFS